MNTGAGVEQAFPHAIPGVPDDLIELLIEKHAAPSIVPRSQRRIRSG